MDIHGIQKMTLLDYPGKVAATVFLGGCDFRCPYCHNFELVDGSVPSFWSEEQLLSFLEKRRGILDGVVITGGEPCLRPDLARFITGIRDMGYLIKLDTNGNSPDRLKELLDKGLVDYVAMDIKNSPDRYGETIGVPDFDVSGVERSVQLLMNSGIDYEFRTTVVKEFHDEKSFENIGKWLVGAKTYFLQQYTDRDTVPDRSLNSPLEGDLRRYLDIVLKYIKNSSIRGV